MVKVRLMNINVLSDISLIDWPNEDLGTWALVSRIQLQSKAWLMIINKET